jgi:hypothetical protein
VTRYLFHKPTRHLCRMFEDVMSKIKVAYCVVAYCVVCVCGWGGGGVGVWWVWVSECGCGWVGGGGCVGVVSMGGVTCCACAAMAGAGGH